MKLYLINGNVILNFKSNSYNLEGYTWDEVVNRDNLYDWLAEQTTVLTPDNQVDLNSSQTPIGNQEVWAAGVTYFKSKEARMEESEVAGGGSFYDRVYMAERPEIFFKSASWRVVGNQQNVRIRRDSTWNVPEPELTLYATSNGKLVGYTIGNDMSSRSIEGENPLYLPQAKSYDGAAAIGPCLYVTKEPLQPETVISITINRDGKSVFDGHVAISQMKRQPNELLDYLFREMSFPQGVYLMTGTGIIPPTEFTLASGDSIVIDIEGIGTLINNVE